MIFRYFECLSVHTPHTYHTPIASKERKTERTNIKRIRRREEHERKEKGKKNTTNRLTDWLIEWNGKERKRTQWNEMRRNWWNDTFHDFHDMIRVHDDTPFFNSWRHGDGRQNLGVKPWRNSSITGQTCWARF